MAIRTLKASGGYFSNIEDFKAYLQAIGTLTEPEELLVDRMQLNTLLTGFGLSGIVTSAANYIGIYAADGQAHTGIAGSGPIIHTESGTSLTLAAINHFRMRGIELSCVSASQNTLSISGTFSADSDVRIEDSILHNTKTGTGYVAVVTGANANVMMDKSVIYGSSRLLDARVTGTGTVKLRRDIFWGHQSQILVLCDAKTVESKGNYAGCAFPGAECFWTAGTDPVGSHNASSDSTASVNFANSLTSVSGASVFASVTAGSEDFRPLNGTTALHNAGIAITGIDTDAIGVAIPQGADPDIGAFEWPESGSTDATATGATLTGTATITPGTASGDINATAPGADITGTATIIPGSASGNSVVDATAPGADLTGTATITPGTASGETNATASGAELTGTASITPGAASGTSSGTFVSSPIYSSGILQASVALDWTWYPGAIGAAPTDALVHGSGATSALGVLTAAGLPTGDGFILAETADGGIYYEPGTVT